MMKQAQHLEFSPDVPQQLSMNPAPAVQTEQIVRRSIGISTIGASAMGALAIGAFSLGALAIGALAIGRLAIGRVVLKSGYARSFSIDELRVGKLVVDDFTRVERSA